MRLRTLEVIPTLRRAGAEGVVVSLALRLPECGFDCAVAALYDACLDDLEHFLKGQRIPVWRLGKCRGPDPRVWLRLARLIRSFSPDIIHTHSYVLRYVAPVAGRCTIVHTLHNLAGRDPDWISGAIDRIWLGSRVQAVAVSKAVARSYHQKLGLKPVAIIPNGIDTTRFLRPIARLNWRRREGFSESDILIVSLARLDEQKDPRTLIKAFAAIAARNSHCRLLLAGVGRLENAVKQWAVESGFGDRIHLLGVRTDVEDLLCASDIFAISSLWEGSPLSVMEAMAAGLPVVATEVGGIPELVTSGVTGLLVEPGASDALAESLGRLADDAELRKSMSQAARARAAEFDVRAMAAAYAALFRRLAGRIF